MYAWTRDYYAFFGLLMTVWMFFEGLFFDEDVAAVMFVLVLIFTVGRAIWFKGKKYYITNHTLDWIDDDGRPR